MFEPRLWKKTTSNATDFKEYEQIDFRRQHVPYVFKRLMKVLPVDSRQKEDVKVKNSKHNFFKSSSFKVEAISNQIGKLRSELLNV